MGSEGIELGLERRLWDVSYLGLQNPRLLKLKATLGRLRYNPKVTSMAHLVKFS